MTSRTTSTRAPKAGLVGEDVPCSRSDDRHLGDQRPRVSDLGEHLRQKRARRLGLRLFEGAIRAAATFFGAGGAVGAAFDGDSNAAQLEDEFVRYLSWVARKRAVVVAIDNVQFLNLDVRLTVESMMQRVGKNVRFVVVERTIGEGPVLDPPVRCFSDNCCELSVRRFTRAETTELVAAVRGEVESANHRVGRRHLHQDLWLWRIHRVLPDALSWESGKGAEVGAVEGLLATIDRLPLIHRQFVVVATLLDGGVDLEIAQNTVRRLTTVRDEAALDVAVEELVAREYLRLNGESVERLQRGHENFMMAVTDLGDEDLQEEARQSLIEELTHTLEDSHDPDKEPYALHCLVGIQTARELSRNLHYISRCLIQTQYRSSPPVLGSGGGFRPSFRRFSRCSPSTSSTSYWTRCRRIPTPTRDCSWCGSWTRPTSPVARHGGYTG